MGKSRDGEDEMFLLASFPCFYVAPPFAFSHFHHEIGHREKDLGGGKFLDRGRGKERQRKECPRNQRRRGGPFFTDFTIFASFLTSRATPCPSTSSRDGLS